MRVEFIVIFFISLFINVLEIINFCFFVVFNFKVCLKNKINVVKLK